MNLPLKTKTFADAVICHANYARLNQHYGHVINPNVQSLMCLWCKSGSGTVVINKKSFNCDAGDYFILPWNHRVEYIPDEKNPFYLTGIHIIPCHDRRHPVEYEVAHNTTHRLYKCPWRKNIPIPGIQGVLHHHLATDSPLFLLSEFAVQLFRSQETKDEEHLRMLAQILIKELILVFNPARQQPPLPVNLGKLLTYIENNLTNHISVAELAKMADRSKSGITTLFRKHCNKSPVRWIIEKRIERACELLSTTGMPIKEAGSAVGIHDQFYFSKLFKKITGQSPLSYRKEKLLF